MARVLDSSTVTIEREIIGTTSRGPCVSCGKNVGGQFKIRFKLNGSFYICHPANECQGALLDALLLDDLEELEGYSLIQETEDE